MVYSEFPVIDLSATGKNILALRKEKGLSVRDLQKYFGFEEPQAIYRWQYGKTLPSVDNLYALSVVLEVPMEKILVPVTGKNTNTAKKQQESPAASVYIITLFHKKVALNNVISYIFPAFLMTIIMSVFSSLYPGNTRLKYLKLPPLKRTNLFAISVYLYSIRKHFSQKYVQKKTGFTEFGL